MNSGEPAGPRGCRQQESDHQRGVCVHMHTSPRELQPSSASQKEQDWDVLFMCCQCFCVGVKKGYIALWSHPCTCLFPPGMLHATNSPASAWTRRCRSTAGWLCQWVPLIPYQSKAGDGIQLHLKLTFCQYCTYLHTVSLLQLWWLDSEGSSHLLSR